MSDHPPFTGVRTTEGVPAGDGRLPPVGPEPVLVLEPPTYRPVGIGPGPAPVYCERCGAEVGLQEKHTAWHLSLTRATQHLSHGLVYLVTTLPGGPELLAEVEAEQAAAADAEQADAATEDGR